MMKRMATIDEPSQAPGAIPPRPTCMNMQSVRRISELPVVESTLQTATNVYEKVKDLNALTNLAFSTAENTVNTAVRMGTPVVAPVVSQFQRPIKCVDNFLCSGLDIVEAKIPAVKLPPSEILFQMYESTKAVVTPVVTTAMHAMEPAYRMVEPAVQSAIHGVEKMIEPVVDRVYHHLHANDVQQEANANVRTTPEGVPEGASEGVRKH